MKHIEHLRAEQRRIQALYRPHRFYRVDQRLGEMIEVHRLSYPSKGAIESTVLVQDIRSRYAIRKPFRMPARDLIRG